MVLLHCISLSCVCLINGESELKSLFEYHWIVYIICHSSVFFYSSFLSPWNDDWWWWIYCCSPHDNEDSEYKDHPGLIWKVTYSIFTTLLSSVRLGTDVREEEWHFFLFLCPRGKLSLSSTFTLGFKVGNVQPNLKLHNNTS